MCINMKIALNSWQQCPLVLVQSENTAKFREIIVCMKISRKSSLKLLLNEYFMESRENIRDSTNTKLRLHTKLLKYF